MIAEILDVPISFNDATSLTESGYVGSDVDVILSSLVNNANGDIKKAELGICVIDEIDKLSRKSESPSLTSQPGNEGVQQALLKIVEGTIAHIPPNGGRKHPDQKLIDIDTTNILFIGIGAFEGIEKKIEKRLNIHQIGYTASSVKQKKYDKDNLLQYIQPQDLKSFGLIPELIGRFPIISHTEPLNNEAMIRILTEPKNAIIKQYQELFKMDGVQLTFAKKALSEIGNIASELGTGARGLRSIVEKVLQHYMFEIPEGGIKKVHITAKQCEAVK
jgi:ATP-dependent Clp protease ATP-binding subunit ClpX